MSATVACRRGIHTIDCIERLHDFGSSLNTAVDFGQIESGIVQVSGWMTMADFVKFDAPFTPEKVLMNLYSEDFQKMSAGR